LFVIVLVIVKNLIFSSFGNPVKVGKVSIPEYDPLHLAALCESVEKDLADDAEASLPDFDCREFKRIPIPDEVIETQQRQRQQHQQQH
jgi:hypothetical protein